MSSFFSFCTSIARYFSRSASAGIGALSVVLVISSLLFAPAALAAKKDAGQSIKSEQSLSRVNINSADAEALAAGLKGIGIKKASAIVQWRKQNGKFKSIDELVLVKGIGESTIEKNRRVLSL